MTNAELWNQYQGYTRDLTKHGRKLGFAGAAICWLFKRDDFTFPLMIYCALFFFVAYFIADIMQALFGALTMKFFIEYHEKRLLKTTGTYLGNIEKPRWVDWPAFVLFIIKCVLLIVGFVFIGLYLVSVWASKHNP